MSNDSASERRRVRSGAEWEEIVGYCRAVAVGPHVYVSGTTAIDEAGKPFAPGDAYAQTERCFQIIGRALNELGGTLDDVVRTRMFVTDIRRWPEIARAHAAAVGKVKPAATMVEVQRLIDDDLLVEVEVDAYLSR